jgi:hypothetical protein
MTSRPYFRFAPAAALALAALGLAGCANNFQANVARFHEALPPPEQGSSFTVQPDDPALAGSLEFAHYGDLVAERLVGLGYVRSADPGAAKLVVRLSYGVDKGTQRVRRDPLAYDPFYYPGPWPYYRGRRAPFIYGFYDPWMWGRGYDDIESFIVYQSELKMKIDKVDGGRVFEGTAKAQSLSNRLTWLVPNLVDALFTGFPGKDGEDIKVTLAPEPKKK